jgi:hypothetical protein
LADVASAAYEALLLGGRYKNALEFAKHGYHHY